MEIKIVYFKKIHDEDLLKSKKALQAKKLIQMLEDDPLFEIAVDNAREILKVNKKNFGKKVSLLRLFEETTKVDNTYPLRAICDGYSLEFSTWVMSIYSFIKYDRMLFPPFRTSGVEIISGKKLASELRSKKSSWLYSDKYIYIQISEKIGKTRLLEIITDNTSQIEKLMTQIKEVATPKINIRKIRTYKLIYQLRKRENKKFSEIALILNDKYNIALSDSEVRNMFRRYKKALLKLHSNKASK